MTTKRLAPLAAAGAVAATAALAAAGTGGAAGTRTTAETLQIQAKLTTRAEVPAPKSAKGGKGSFTGLVTAMSKSTGKITWRLSFSGLSGPATAAHIHLGKAGTAGAVLIPLCGPCKNGQSGNAMLSAKAITAIKTGKAYVNVHTAANPGGEIRGQLGAKSGGM